MSAQPFKIAIPQDALVRVLNQVREYQWPRQFSGWSDESGANYEVTRYLAEYWISSFDWRLEETEMNELPQFITTIDSVNIHFVHLRRADESAQKAIVLIHGWPSSMMEYCEVAKRIVADPDASCDVIVISLPGFGFSGPLFEPVGPRKIARLINKLLVKELGYESYICHGSDWGSIVSAWAGFDFPDACHGVHLTMISPKFIGGLASGETETKWLSDFRKRFEDDGAYFLLQAGRPSTAGLVLASNPVGLLAWMLDKFQAWSDPKLGGSEQFKTPASARRLIRNVMIYLVTLTSSSSLWIYRGMAIEGPPGYPEKKRVEVPVGMLATNDPIFVPPPRSLVEKAYRVTRWTELEAGGHFPAYDHAPEVASDILDFSRSVETES